jgi:hypothetical protein
MARYDNQPSGVLRASESASKGAASLPELVELSAHPVEGAVLVAGAALEVLAPTNQNL